MHGSVAWEVRGEISEYQSFFMLLFHRRSGEAGLLVG
jgi:hypothetical protein